MGKIGTSPPIANSTCHVTSISAKFGNILYNICHILGYVGKKARSADYMKKNYADPILRT
jgi:hypothetical protein